MQYHTLSLLEAGYVVEVIAQPGAALIPQLQQQPQLKVHYLQQPPAAITKLPTILGLALKVVYQLLVMMWLMLVQLPRPAAILMQNPPAIPAMLLCWLAAVRHRASLIIDWHNLAYTIMEMKYAKYPWLSRLAKSHERWMGRWAHYHFCVTEAMQQYLQQQFGIQAVVLYDRPPAFFAPGSLAQKHELFSRLQGSIVGSSLGTSLKQYQPDSSNGSSSSSSSSKETLISSKQGGRVVERSPRPFLLISSTSWTPDEDFGVLLEAAQFYDAAAVAAAGGAGSNGSKQQQQQQQLYPDVLCVITGRGPQRDMYLQRIRQLSLVKVAFCSLWLEPEDYPRMLGCADLGVCLHTSSSGLDLPMKVVDMFGAGLPVCAVEYQCIQELVTPGVTGLLFQDGAQPAAAAAGGVAWVGRAAAAAAAGGSREAAGVEVGRQLAASGTACGGGCSGRPCSLRVSTGCGCSTQGAVMLASCLSIAWPSQALPVTCCNNASWPFVANTEALSRPGQSQRCPW
jgi:beta-1,4-mannosyltransferase